MPVVKWKKCYETQINSLDKEHQKLVELINRLHEAMCERRTEEVMLSIFDELVEYTKLHFAHEEKLLAEYNYPDLELQREQHQQLAQEVCDLRQQLVSGTGLAAPEVMGFLRGWLMNHIVKYDLKYGPYLESRAGRFLT